MVEGVKGMNALNGNGRPRWPCFRRSISAAANSFGAIGRLAQNAPILSDPDGPIRPAGSTAHVDAPAGAGTEEPGDLVVRIAGGRAAMDAEEELARPVEVHEVPLLALDCQHELRFGEGGRGGRQLVCEIVNKHLAVPLCPTTARHHNGGRSQRCSEKRDARPCYDKRSKTVSTSPHT